MKQLAQGFTLIELMIVVAIVAILAGVGYPSYQSYIMDNNRNEAKTGLMQLQLLQEQYFLDNRSYASSLASGAVNTLSGWSDSSALYDFSLDASSSANSYIAIATANASGAQASDADCRSFRLSSVGERTATNSANNSTTDCW